MLFKQEILTLFENVLEKHFAENSKLLKRQGQNTLLNTLRTELDFQYDQQVSAIIDQEETRDELGKPIDIEMAHYMKGAYHEFMTNHPNKVHKGADMETSIYFSRGKLLQWVDQNLSGINDSNVDIEIHLCKYPSGHFPTPNDDYNDRITVCFSLKKGNDILGNSYYNFGGICPPKCT